MENVVVRKVVGKVVFRLAIILVIVSILAIGFFVVFSARLDNTKGNIVSSKNIESKFEVNEWSHWLIYYDEVLTQSARNYAYSNDIKWKIRYDKTLKDLYKLISLILSKSKNKDLILFQQFEQVNSKLAEMEERSFKYMSMDNRILALEVLDSKKYEDYKIEYQKLIQNYLEIKTLNYKNSFIKYKNNALFIINYNKERATFISDTFFIIIILFIIFSTLFIWFIIKRIKKITMFVDQAIVGNDFSEYEIRHNNDFDDYVSSLIQILKSSRIASDNYYSQELSIQLETLRNEFKRNLHDRLGVLVSATKLHFYLLKPDDQKTELIKHYKTCLNLLDQTFNEIKLLSNSDESISANSNLIDRIKALVSFFKTLQDLEIEIQYDFDESVLSNQQKECIELIIREALNNTIRHGKSNLFNISILQKNDKLMIKVSDDGVGFDIINLNRKSGLSHMEQRVKQLNGEIYIYSEIGHGTQIEVVL